jgi:hypothetical protein
MTLTWLGRVALYIAFAGTLGGIMHQAVALRTGRASRSLRWALVSLLGVVGAVAVMQFALITHNFSLAYVSENNATFTPLLYSITGMWSALEGSLLLWALLLASLIAVVVRFYRRQSEDHVVGWATVVLFSVSAFFIGLMCGPADPFIHNGAKILQGAGPNALLQDNPLVAIHPPLLYAGFVGFTVPFAFAIAMLVTGRVHDRWPLEQRRWTVLAWGVLSVGIVLGAWWSYQVLGWGGFWGWDPVENAALLPWLTGTAYIHSVIVQDRRGLFRVWNLSLAIATFSLTVLGTFFTRSGVLQSVHAFSSSTLGPLLIGFFAVTVVLGVGLLAWRGDRLRSPVGVDHALSREGLFIANNVLFVGFAVVVLLGTVFPLLYEAVNGGQVTVGTPYFASVAVPMSIVLLVLMTLAPLVGWRTLDARVLWSRVRVAAVGLVVGRGRARTRGRAQTDGAARVLPRDRGRGRRASNVARRVRHRAATQPTLVGRPSWTERRGDDRAPRGRHHGDRHRDVDLVHDAQRSDIGDRSEYGRVGSVRDVQGISNGEGFARNGDATPGGSRPPRPVAGHHHLQRTERPERRDTGHRLQPRARRLRDLRRRRRQRGHLGRPGRGKSAGGFGGARGHGGADARVALDRRPLARCGLGALLRAPSP